MGRVILLASVLAGLVSAQVPPPDAELQQAASATRLPALKALFEEFAIPHDSVRLRGRREAINIRPLPFLNRGRTNHLKGTLKLVPIDPAEKADALAQVSADDIMAHTSYEILALDRLKAFNKEQEALASVALFAANEQVLKATLRFHQSQQEEGLRQGAEWAEIHKELSTSLRKVHLTQLEAHIRNKSWDRALALATQLLGKDAVTVGGPAELEALSTQLLALVAGLQADARLDDARKLTLLTEISKAIQPLRQRPVVARSVERLEQLAREAFDEASSANGLIQTDKPRAQQHQSRALEYLARAEKLWPYLDELRSFELRVERPDSVLRVGVRELPVFFSPSRAVTDDERRVVDLVFESLVKRGEDSFGHPAYTPSLAEAAPTIIPQGRRFHLAPNALWSNGKPVLPVDVNYSLQQIQQGHADPFALTAALFLERVEVRGNPRRVDVHFRRGCLEPLSPLAFKIVPAGSDPHSDSFARSPVGSGPFQVEGIKTLDGQPTLVLRVNPRFGKRPGMSSYPGIRAIHFVVSSNPMEDFAKKKIDLALDVPASRLPSAAELERLKLRVPGPGKSATNRRVHYLAVNHGKAGLHSVELRRALAHSVPRVEMLDLLEGKEQPHRPLSGLFPRDSWVTASTETAKRDLFDKDLARACLEKAIRSAATLTVHIPAGDPILKTAFELWAERLATLSGGQLKLDIQAVPLLELRALLAAGKFELAYTWYDYPDDTFLLEPLSRSTWSNATRDSVDRDVRAALDHREFDAIKKATLALATKLETEMPVIPLWQLTPRHLMHESVQVVDFDPYQVFSAVERWTLKAP